MNYSQYRKARKILSECCNYDNSKCLLLDTVCPQAISYTLLCRWFKEAVLPLDKELSAMLLHKKSSKLCVMCGKAFIPNSNRTKYCSDCSTLERKRKDAARQRRRYAAKRHNSTHLETLKAL